MRCEDLTRELASPTGRLSPAEMAEHMAGCPGCGSWSRRAAKFDRIWEETRPAEPTIDALDALWARASVALEAPPAAATLRLEGLSHRRVWLKPSLIVAQVAAAILLAALFLLRQGGKEPVQVVVTPPVPAPAPVKPVRLVAEIDRPILVSIDKDNGFTVSHFTFAYEDSSVLPDDTPHDLFNELESKASLASSLAIR